MKPATINTSSGEGGREGIPLCYFEVHHHSLRVEVTEGCKFLEGLTVDVCILFGEEDGDEREDPRISRVVIRNISMYSQQLLEEFR